MHRLRRFGVAFGAGWFSGRSAVVAGARSAAAAPAASKERPARTTRRILLGLFVPCLLLTGCSGRPDDVDHTTSTRGADPLRDVGPPPGSFATQWRVAGPGDENSTYRLAGGNVVTVTKTAVRANDARTGKPTWHYGEPGRRLVGAAFTDDAVVLSFISDDTEPEPHLVGLDAGTGRLLWENGKQWSLTQGGDDSVADDRIADSGDGIVPVVDSAVGDVRRLGIDARTGEERWQIQARDVVDADCRPKDESAPARSDGAAVIPALLPCDTGPTPSQPLLVAIDAATGDPLWTRKSRLSSPAFALARGGLVLHTERCDRPGELVDRTGRRILAVGADVLCDAQLFVTGGHAALVHDAGGSDERVPRITLVDIRSGRTRTVADPADGSEDYLSAGERLYALQDPMTPSGLGSLLPAGLVTVDVATGRAVRAPLPYPGEEFRRDNLLRTTVRLVGVGGRRIVTVSHRTRGSKAKGTILRSHVSTGTRAPVELGGVSPKDWPDACRLLSGVRRRADDTSSTRRWATTLEIGRATVENPVCNRYDTDLRVVWVARTDKEAATTFGESVDSTVGADQERRTYTGERLLRVGRVIVSVDLEPDSDYDADVVARAVVRNARAHAS